MINKIKEFFGRFKKKESSDEVQHQTEEDVKQNKNLRNWYQERYDNIIVQRNLLFLLLLVLVCLSVVSVASVAYVVNTKEFDPFVIQIDDTTGAAQIVNPTSSNVISGNEALAQYFIKRYITARETYNPVDFDKGAKKIVRLLSTSRIYWAYRGYLRNPDVNPQIRYGQKNTTYLTVKSWSKLSDTKYIMRFSINETGGARRVFHKIAVVEFQYIPIEITESDKDINPIGFQITEYRVDNDSS